MPDPEIPMGGDAPAPEVQPDPTDQQARALYDGLQNLDRRAETLGQVLRPGQDLPPGMDWQQARALLFSQAAQPEEEYEPDVFDEQFGPEPNLLGYDQMGEPVYDQPVENTPFDPRSLAPVFDTYTEHAKYEAVEAAKQWLGEQMRDQALSQGVQQAATEHKLNDFDRGIVENLTRQAVQQQPNRAPADVANDVAKQYIDNMNRRFVEQSGAPVARPGAPGGPAPGEERPKTEAEAMEWSRRMLTPGI